MPNNLPTFVSVRARRHGQPCARVHQTAVVTVEAATTSLTLAIVPIIITVVSVFFVQHQLSPTTTIAGVIAPPSKLHRGHGRRGGGGHVAGLAGLCLNRNNLLYVVVVLVRTVVTVVFVEIVYTTAGRAGGRVGGG